MEDIDVFISFPRPVLVGLFTPLARLSRLSNEESQSPALHSDYHIPLCVFLNTNQHTGECRFLSSYLVWRFLLRWPALSPQSFLVQCPPRATGRSTTPICFFMISSHFSILPRFQVKESLISMSLPLGLHFWHHSFLRPENSALIVLGSFLCNMERMWTSAGARVKGLLRDGNRDEVKVSAEWTGQ